MFSNFKDYIDNFKKSAVHDPIGLYEIIGCLKKNFNVQNENELENLSLEFVRDMLAEGFEAGNLAAISAGFFPWQEQSSSSIISKIQKEWQELGRTPNIGDIVYFDLKNQITTR